MTKLHAKSPCCRGEIYRFGNRRRQCALCKKTWRIRQKKKGRKKKREGNTLLIRYLQHEIPSLCSLAKLKGVSEDRLGTRLAKSRDNFLAHTLWPTFPEKGPLIIVADAMVRYIERVWYTFYFVVIRKPEDGFAMIAKPVIRKGIETQPGWYEALDRLPDTVKPRIVTMVCDGHRGLVNYAKKEKWLLQRCHFHLVARIQSRRSKRRWSRHRKEGQHIYDLVHHILTTTDEKTIMPCLLELEEISWLTKSSDLKTTLSGFVEYYKDYRTYLYHPELNLPRTSNSAESLIGMIKNFCYRARGFRSINSLEKWIAAVIKNKKKIKCSGYFQPNKHG